MRTIDFSNLPEADLIIDNIEQRYRKGLNSNIFIIGLSGTGKSSSSIRLGELIEIKRKETTGEQINIFIVDSLLELLRALRKSKKGDVIIIEEVSVLFSSRRAMAGDNVAIGKVLDTCRKKELCIISNAPIWNSIDSHMRALGHFIIETLRVNKTEGVVVSKMHRLQTNPGSGKTYKHTMTRGGADVQRMFTKMPSMDRWNKYESQKDKFMDELYQKLESQELKKQDKENKELSKQNTKIKDLSKREIEVHQLYFRKGMKQQEIADQLGLSQPRINTIIKNIIKKSENTKENSPNNAIKDKEGAIK